tara:strand:- start:713 stop:967 length:255 start_codon:yes stop_codon:yes gene_type:complete
MAYLILIEAKLSGRWHERSIEIGIQQIMAVQLTYGFEMYHHAAMQIQFLIDLQLDCPGCAGICFDLVFICFVLVHELVRSRLHF